MPTQELIFTGYSSFNGKNDKNKIYYKLQFISQPSITRDRKRAFYETIDIFVDMEIFNKFIENHALLDIVAIPYVIVGSKVSYYIN